MTIDINCALCNRPTPKKYAEKHHVIPKSKGGKDYEMVCAPCGDQVHLLFTNKELKTSFNTIEKLKSDERVQKWIKFISKRNDYHVCMKTKKRG